MKASWAVLGMLAAFSAQAKVKIVATLPDLGAIAKEIAGDQADVVTLAKYTQDPHYVDAKPSFVLDLSRADLLLLNGMELEVGWLPVLLTQSRNANIQPGTPGYLDCSTLITPKEVPLQKLDRSMGDIHPGGNPHYTKDPRNALKLADGIAARLAELSPSSAAKVKANAEAFKKRLQGRIAEWEKTLAPFKGTPVITYHKSWIYFTDWAGLDEVGFVEPKPGLQPSIQHLAAVVGIIKSRHVPVILQEQWYNAAVTEQLARSSGATVVRVPGMTPDGKRYDDGIAMAVDELAKALSARSGQKM